LTLNYLEQQEYYNAIRQLQYYQDAIKDKCDYLIEEEFRQKVGYPFTFQARNQIEFTQTFDTTWVTAI